MAALPCCTEGTWKRSAAPRVDWPVYPRRAEHNTVAEGGNRRWAEADQKTPVSPGQRIARSRSTTARFSRTWHLAVGVEFLFFESDSPQRNGRGDGLVRLDGDRDLDHATPRLIGTPLSAICPRARACSSDRLISSRRQRPTTAAFQRRDDLPLLGVQALIWLRRHGRA